jgi:hypothetical protein
MATFTITGAGTSGYSAKGPNVKVMSQVVDFTKFTVAAGDIVEVISLPAGSTVIAAGYEILTAGTGTGTLALGDQTDVDRYVDEIVQTAAGQKTMLTAAFPVNYASAETLDLTVATATVNSKVNVWAVVADCNNVEDDQKVTIS